MIINKQLSHEAEYLGNIQENRVGIDRSNIDFITTLLTSNLYSQPLSSFLRETVSNAYDSHVEAGTTDPILLLIEDANDKGEYDNYRISIRDYGTGLSAERFEQIYKNVGSSTKRESNDYIGMFGIGRFSCLSCADTANITSYYEGKKYSYIMYKNGGGINIDRISVVSGEYKNGLEVSIKMHIPREYNIVEGIFNLILFDSLHVEYKGTSSTLKHGIDSFNNRKIDNYNTFKFCKEFDIYGGVRYHKSRYFSVGKVIYEANPEVDDNIHTEGIIIELPMGFVDITPNREALQYTDFTKNTIKSKTSKVKEELQTILEDYAGKITSLSEIGKAFFDRYNTVVIWNNDNNRELLEIKFQDVDFEKVSEKICINGKKAPSEFINFLSSIRGLQFTKGTALKVINPVNLSNKTINTAYSRGLNMFIMDGCILGIRKERSIREVVLQYVRSTSNNYIVVFSEESLEKWKEYLVKYKLESFIRSRSASFTPSSTDTDKIKEVVDYFFSCIPTKEISINNVPQEYIDAWKATTTSNTTIKLKEDILKDNVSIRTYREGTYDNYGTFKNVYYRCSIIVYAANTTDDSNLRNLSYILYRICSAPSAIITVKKEYIPVLQKLKKCVYFEDFIELKNPILSKLATAKVILDNFKTQIDKYGLSTLYSEIPIFASFSKSKKYNKYVKLIKGWQTYTVEEYLKALYTKYINNKWLNFADIAYYSLSDDEAKAIKDCTYLRSNQERLIVALLYKKYGSLPKVGVKPAILPNI